MPINFTILNLTSFPTYFPVNKKIVEKNPRLASKPETYLGCGPFKLVKWEHNHKMEFEKNENYLDSADVRIRKALALSIDRKSIVKKITTPALAFVPSGIIQNGKDFRKEGGNYFKDNDIETAKKLLEEAGYKDGKNFPQITVLYNTSESHKMIAEAVQEMWRKNLGINVNQRK
jgi:ABC-type oligopeptide transport system substrate-binding subunit